jgi:galactose mutarotase-like enzyme
MITLLSQYLEVKIKKQGAELCSVTDKKETEFIWQGNKDVWPRHAPVLFPIVGKLKDNRYHFEERSYELPQHGFARDMEFSLLEHQINYCLFRLQSNEETKKKYPFDFDLEIAYELREAELITHYRIRNRSKGKMLFSIGAHPGFNCPLYPDEIFEDYYLEFENGQLIQSKLKDGLISAEKTTLSPVDTKLPLSASLFENDALVFEDSQINKISLRSRKSSGSIILSCAAWPYFGIWTKKGNREFICLEPWHGIADSVSADQKLENKKGIIALDAGKEFECSFSCSFNS